MNRAIVSRGCKRCGGDLFWEQDKYGRYLSCIQCGAEYQPQQPSISLFGKEEIASDSSADRKLVGAGSR